VLNLEDEELKEAKVADIRFGFENNKMIELLKKRGTLITKNGLKKDINQNENEIKDFISENK
jgi:hypothetical protein